MVNPCPKLPDLFVRKLDFAVDVPAVRAYAFAFHLRGGDAQMNSGNFLNPLPLVASVVDSDFNISPLKFGVDGARPR
jgi:hypothetical protein